MRDRRAPKVEDLFHHASLARYHTYFTEPAPEFVTTASWSATRPWSDESALPWLAPRRNSFE
jgi:hypothetical protein